MPDAPQLDCIIIPTALIISLFLFFCFGFFLLFRRNDHPNLNLGRMDDGRPQVEVEVDRSVCFFVAGFWIFLLFFFT